MAKEKKTGNLSGDDMKLLKGLQHVMESINADRDVIEEIVLAIGPEMCKAIISTKAYKEERIKSSDIISALVMSIEPTLQFFGEKTDTSDVCSAAIAVAEVLRFTHVMSQARKKADD